LKFAVSVMGPFIVIVAELDDPLYDPEPEPLQLANWYPLFAEAEIVTVEPASHHPEPRLTDPAPDGLTFMVR